MPKVVLRVFYRRAVQAAKTVIGDTVSSGLRGLRRRAVTVLAKKRSISRIFVAWIIIVTFASACSTTGEFYKENDPKNGEFSTIRTILLPIAIAGAVVLVWAIVNSPNNESTTRVDPKWDFMPGSGTWACRNAVNGQFLDYQQCYGQPMVDNWPYD